MNILEVVCASAPADQRLVDTLELYCPVWAQRVYMVQGYEEFAAATETGLAVNYLPAPINMSLPKKSNDSNQTLTFAIDNVTGEAQRLLDQALEAEARVTLTFRRYVESDLTGPAEVFTATVLNGQFEGSAVQLAAGFFSLLDYAYPRDTLNLNIAPALAYL